MATSKILTPFQVADANKALADAGFSYRLHLHDACGGQTLSYECTRVACDAPFLLRSWIRSYFEKLGYEMEFHDSEPLFWVK